jgi:hypothetical protein
MRTWRILAAAAVLCVPAAAGAQDAGPAPAPKKEEAPAKHVNKISDAAKALFEKYDKICYTPVRGGLKDLQGAVMLEVEGAAGGEGGEGGAAGGGGGGPGGAPGGPGGAGGARGGGGRGGMAAKMMGNLVFTVSFKAPDDLKVGLKDSALPDMGGEAEGPMAERLKQMKENMSKGISAGISQMLRTMVEGFVPAKDAEFDADVRVENGVSCLVLTSYLKGVEVSHTEFLLDANGLPSTGTIANKSAEGGGPGGPGGPGGRGMRGGPDGKSTIKFAYEKEGEMYRLDKMTFEGRGGSTESKLLYTDAGGFKVVYAWEMPTPMGTKLAVKFSELTVNGKPVVLPVAATATDGKDGKKGGDGGAGEGGGMGGEGGK